MDNAVLEVSPRDEKGKGPNRRLRAQGLIPGVIYGTGETPVSVSVNYRMFEKLMRYADAENHLFTVKGAGVKDGSVAVIREIQRDPLTRRFLHVDLLRVNMNQETEFQVAIHGTGTPAGVREGGMLETLLREVTVRCLPANIPDGFTVNIEGLKVNQSLHVSDLELPAGVTMITDAAEALFTVIQLRTSDAAAEGEASAPEVIGKKKDDA